MRFRRWAASLLFVWPLPKSLLAPVAPAPVLSQLTIDLIYITLWTYGMSYSMRESYQSYVQWSSRTMPNDSIDWRDLTSGVEIKVLHDALKLHQVLSKHWSRSLEDSVERRRRGYDWKEFETKAASVLGVHSLSDFQVDGKIPQLYGKNYRSNR